MVGSQASETLRSPAEARPALLEGRWSGLNHECAWLALHPVGVLEGSGEALPELPSWIDWHARRYPSGAAIGYFAYELARFFEALPLARDKSLFDFSFAFYPELREILWKPLPCLEAADLPDPEIHASFDRRSYARSVEAIRQYIAAGDIYQANLTQQFVVRLEGLSPEEIYLRLSRGQAPFRAFLKTSQATIVSNSPERFFRVSRGRILASPIKGTIPRGVDAFEDARQLAELLTSPKDRAENLMIVDLLRNDLGRICRFGSISARLWKVETLPHLFHLVSHAEGSLRPEVGVLEIVRALFPCGSITGAPKIRAMEILAAIEQAPRGISMGAVGIIRGQPGSPLFEMDFNVAIRTMMIRDDVAVFNVGGGIVYDSASEAEYKEMMLKARPLLEAVRAPGLVKAPTAPEYAHGR